MRGKDFFWFAVGLGVALLLVGAWEVFCRVSGISQVFLPRPMQVWQSLVAGFSNGTFVNQSLSTLYRMLLGWSIATLAGVAIGIPLGLSRIARQYVEPLLELLRPLPASAMVPVTIAMFGLSNTMVLAVVVFGSVWPVLLNTMHGVSTIEPRLGEVSRVLGLSRLSFVRSIALPNAVPDVLAGMKLSLSIALILTVVGEMLSSRSGLGQGILFAARTFRAADLYAGIVCLGLMGYLTAAILSAIEKRILVYR